MYHAGVIVRRVHADSLEESYESAGKDHYLFAIDQSEFIVDATNQGGMARFVNHSCRCFINNPQMLFLTCSELARIWCAWLAVQIVR
jgi:SET domain-containing protein